MQNSAKTSSEYKVKHQIMHAEQNKDDSLLIIKIQKRAIKSYNHLKGSDSQTFYNNALTYREINLENSPLSQLMLRLCSNTQRPYRAPG